MPNKFAKTFKGLLGQTGGAGQQPGMPKSQRELIRSIFERVDALAVPGQPSPFQALNEKFDVHMQEPVRILYILSEKIDRINHHAEHVRSGILEPILTSLSEKVDVLLQNRHGADRVETFVSQEIDRLDGYLNYHVERLRSEAQEPTSILISLSEKLDILLQNRHGTERIETHVSQEIDRLDGYLNYHVERLRSEAQEPTSILISLSEKLDILLQNRHGAERIETHVSQEIDRLDGYLKYHVELLRGEAKEPASALVALSEKLDAMMGQTAGLQEQLREQVAGLHGAMREPAPVLVGLSEKLDLLLGQATGSQQHLHEQMAGLHGAVREPASILVGLSEKLDALIGEMANARAEPGAAFRALNEKVDGLLQRQAKIDAAPGAHSARDGVLYSSANIDALLDLDGYDLVLPSSEVGLLSFLTRHGLARYEPAVRQALRKCLKPGDVAVDVGTNVGLHSLVMATSVGADGRLIGIEALDHIARTAQKTLQINGFAERTTFVRAALTDKVGETTIYVTGHSPNSSLFGNDAAGAEPVTIPSTTLDAIVPAGGRVDLIKLDIEGAEPLAWKGMSRVLRENPDLTLLMEWSASHFQRSGHSADAFLRVLKNAGFEAWLLDDEAPDDPIPLDFKTAAALEATNLLFRRRTSNANAWPTKESRPKSGRKPETKRPSKRTKKS